jgi:hypothetical protein
MDDRLRQVLDDPALFLVTYFPDRIRKLEEFHLDLIRVATQERLGLEFFPAGHGKTTIVSELLPIWAICRDPNIRIALIAKNDDDAKAITRSIQNELSQNEALIRDFGPFKPDGDTTKAWALGRFDVIKRTRAGKSNTFASFGAGSRGTLGYRTDWTICDDVVTDKTSETPEQRAKLKQWFMQGPKTMAEGANGQLTVVGTMFHPDDLYHELRDQVLPDSGEPLWRGNTYRAVTDWEKHEVLWPEQRPWRWLMEMKASQGTLDFLKRFQNVAVDASRMVFKDEYVRGGYIGKIRYPGCIDPTYNVGDWQDNWKLYCGFDPAIGKLSRSAKFCAHITLARGSCAKHPEGCYWVVDLERDQMTQPQQVDMIIAKHQQYMPWYSKVEANSYQAGLLDAIKLKQDELGISLNIGPHYTSRMNKPDPESGVQAMAPWFENGKVHIPWGNPESQRKMTVLVDELIQYPGRTTDTVMAFWFAWRCAQEGQNRLGSFNRLSKTPRLQRAFGGKHVVRNPAYS